MTVIYCHLSKREYAYEEDGKKHQKIIEKCGGFGRGLLFGNLGNVVFFHLSEFCQVATPCCCFHVDIRTAYPASEQIFQ